MKVFITGVQGFIGSRLRAFLKGQGYTIYGSSSKVSKSANGPYPAGNIFYHKLGEPVAEDMFNDIDLVIHCAHDFQKGALRNNVEGTLALAEAAQKQRVKQQIFISSLSSRPDAQSDYGKAKYEIENYFRTQGGLILRPGTVLGPGGIFAKMVDLLKRLPVLPLLDGGHSQMFVIGIDDLCRAIYQLIQVPGKNNEYNLYYPEKVTLKDMLTTLRRLLNRRTLFFPLPSSVLIGPMTLIDSLGIRLPVDIDNLRGFITSQTLIYPSDLVNILKSCESIEAILKKYFLVEN